jgi:hypothetical protein
MRARRDVVVELGVEDGYVVGVTRAQRDVVAAEEVMPCVWLHPATLAATGVDRKYRADACCP